MIHNNRLRNRILSLVLAFVMVLGMMPLSSLTAVAATTPTAYDGKPVTPTIITSSNYRGFGLTDENWSQYDGYYGIRNAKELYGFANLVNGMNGYCSDTSAVLLQDIVVNSYVSEYGAAYEWTPIGLGTVDSSGNGAPYYTGTFDGNGHYISGLYASGEDHIGLFGSTGYSRTTVIKNLTIKNSYFSGSTYVGGIVGYMFWNNTTVSNCKIDSDVTVHASGQFVGGIVGGSFMLDSTDQNYGNYKKDNQVNNCVNFGTVKTTGSSNAVGGIAGAWAKETDYSNRLITVTNSYYLSGRASNSNGTVDWGCGTYVETTSWASSDGCTALTAATDSHTCVSVEHKETTANCAYPGLSKYSYCLICDKITSGTKTETAASSDLHVFYGATCRTVGTCWLCGAKGDKDADTHESEETIYVKNGTQHNICHSCCGAVISSEAHTYGDDNSCIYCGSYTPAGEENGVYQIYTATDLMWFAEYVNAGKNDVNAILMNDIDMTGYEWEPISSTDLYYKTTTYANIGYNGTFNGNGKVIRNLSIIGSSVGDYSFGLFGTLSGTVKNLGMENITYTGAGKDTRVGSIAGQVLENGTIENCYVANVNINTQVNTTNGVAGGLAGANYSGTVKNSYAYNVTITAGRFGSVVGDNYGDISTTDRVGTIDNCYTDGSAITGSKVGNVTDCTAGISADTFASGEIAYKLNGSTSEGVLIWYQTIGTDDYPKFSGGTVYPSTPCTVPKYSNSPVNDHIYVSGICSSCGALQQPTEPVLVDQNNYSTLGLDDSYIGYYAISNINELYWFAGLVNGTLEGVEQNGSANAVLLNDITVNANLFDSDGNLVSNTDALTEWIPIGFNVDDPSTRKGYEFSGIFDGRNHTISGLYHNNTENWYVGLIGFNLGTVCNVTVKNSYLKANQRVGSIAGWNEGSIYNCASVGCVFDAPINGLVGGIVGISNGGFIENCYNTSTVSGTERIGGICGALQLNCSITNCYNTGAVAGTGNNVGGIAGYNGYKGVSTINDCYNTGSVSGKERVGGISGALQHGGTVTNCYNTGTVTGTFGFGGIVGLISDTAISANSKVENCYFNSDVFSGSGVGYLVQGTATNVEGKTTEQFKSGEVAYLLNLGVTDGTQTWYQTIDTDAIPQFDGGTVYLVKTGTCQELTLSYSNTAGDSYTDHPGYTDDGFCTLCGAPQKPALNTNGYYEIKNAGNLFWFAGLVNDTLTDGTPQNVGAKAKLMTNLNISSYEWVPIGVSDAFTGVLDGGGYTLTVALSGERYMAPIAYAYGATVRNLTVDGTITASGMNAAGIISWIRGGDVVIENCLSSVDIISSVNGDGTHGGLVGVANAGTLTINNCGFVGSITGDATYSCGGLVGWAAVTTNVNNSYVAGTFTLDVSTGNSNTFGRNPGQVTLDNCYYLNALQNTPDTAIQMTQAQFESGEVTYKLNNGVTDGTQEWYQTIGTDKYPVFKGMTVCYDETADPQYYNTETEIISVTIAWTDMSFTYNKGTWNTETLTWDGGGWVAEEGCGTVTVENTGTVDVNAEFTVKITDTAYAGYSVGFTTDGVALTDKKLNIPAGESKTVSVTLTGDEPTAYIEDKKTIGQITIVLSTE